MPVMLAIANSPVSLTYAKIFYTTQGILLCKN